MFRLKSRGEILSVATSDFRSSSHKHERTHCTHHQINFSLIYVRTLSGSRGVTRASGFPWEAPQYVGNPGNESSDMWARGTGSRPTWSRQQRHPPPPLLLIQRRRYFCLFLISCTAGGLQRDRLHYFTQWGRFSGRGKVKQHKKTTTFAYWADLTAQNCWQLSKCGPLRRWNNLQPLPSAVFKG